jgi:hypothetical protein
MFFTIFVPEYIIRRAMSEVLAVHDMVRKTKSQWEEVPTHMANMGYFVLDFSDYWLASGSSDTGRKIEDRNPFNSPSFRPKPAERDYSPREKLEGILQEEDDLASARLNLHRLTHPYWVLNARQLDLLIPGIVDMPTVPGRHLELLDRGGILVKVLALVQIVYLIIQLIARKVAGLPSAQLEIGALAFSASSFITYVLYWNRPQEIESIHIMKAKVAPSISRILQVAEQGPIFLWTMHRPEARFEKSERSYDLVPIQNDSLHNMSRMLPQLLYDFFDNMVEIPALAAATVVGGILFGGLHCLAWTFHFPTRGEALA